MILKAVHVECRDYGHAWKRVGLYEWDGDVCVRNLACMRCGAVKRERMTQRGRIMTRTTKYQDGYLLPRGTKRQKKEYWRRVDMDRYSNRKLRVVKNA